jgi:ABC-2 type transport system ATP-binding protein
VGGEQVSILFDNVHKTFVSSFPRKKVQAVSGFNLEVQPGEILGIVGPNGAGKSTVLKMLMGFIRPSAGSITVLNNTPDNPKTRQKIGYLPENPYYYDHLSAEELMRFSAVTSGIKPAEIQENIEHLLETMNLAHARKRKLRSYSKGMIQRAGICFALIHDPQLVILDEPMSGLDPVGRKLVVDLILQLKKEGKTVLFCSHILNDVERLCDRMAIMAGGELKNTLTRFELTNQQNKTVLVVKALPQPLLEMLSETGMKVEQGEEHVRIYCPNQEINGAIQQLVSNDIHIVRVEKSSNVLEDIFLNTIQLGVNPCGA